MNPSKYHIFQGMIQGTCFLSVAVLLAIPAEYNDSDKAKAVPRLGLVFLSAYFIVLTLARRQGDIYRQSVLKIASKYNQAKIQVEEGQADIVKLQQAYVISEDDVAFIDRLSAGGFGEVWKGTFKRIPGVPVAIKKIFLTPENMEVLLEQGIFGDQEIKLLMRLNNERVVKFFGAGTLKATGQPFLVNEFMDGGDLRVFLDNCEPAWKLRFQIALDIADGMGTCMV